MKKRHVICIIAVCVCVIGNLIEYICTNELPYRVNRDLSISMFTLIVFGLICEPAGNWLNEPIYKSKNTKQKLELAQHIKERVAAAIREFGFSISSNMKSLYWPEKGVFIILWCDSVLMCSDKSDGSSITGLSTKYTNKDLEKFLDYAHKLITDNMPQDKSKS